MPQYSLKKAKECGAINEQITDRIVALYLLNEEWHKLPSSMHAKIAAEVGASASSMQPQFSKFFSKLKDNNCHIATAEGDDAADTTKETTTAATTKKAAPKKAALKTAAPKKGVATKAAPKKRKADEDGGEAQTDKPVKKATRGRNAKVKSEETVEKSEDDEEDAGKKEKVEEA